MKVLGIVCSPRKGGNTEIIVENGVVRCFLLFPLDKDPSTVIFVINKILKEWTQVPFLCLNSLSYEAR